MLAEPLPPLCALTDLRASGAASHPDLVALLVAAGIRFVQLREKAMDDSDLFREAVAAVRVARSSSALLIVNDRPDVALAAGADGVHLGEEDLPAEAARRVLGPRAVIGVSTHSEPDALRAAEGPVDYVAVGPIYPSRTKPTDRAPLGAETIARIRKRTTVPLVAIGGITAENLREVLEAGADCAALVAGLYDGGELAARVARLEEILRGRAPR